VSPAESRYGGEGIVENRGPDRGEVGAGEWEKEEEGKSLIKDRGSVDTEGLARDRRVGIGGRGEFGGEEPVYMSSSSVWSIFVAA
jgi:hypothetical protein